MLIKLVGGITKYKEVVGLIAFGVLVSLYVIEKTQPAGGRAPASESPLPIISNLEEKMQKYTDKKVADSEEKSALRQEKLVIAIEGLSKNVEAHKESIRILSQRVYDLNRDLNRRASVDCESHLVATLTNGDTVCL